jgi:hypothetical protein
MSIIILLIFIIIIISSSPNSIIYATITNNEHNNNNKIVEFCTYHLSKEFPTSFDSTQGLIDYSISSSTSSDSNTYHFELGQACGEFKRATCCSKKQTGVIWKLLVAQQRNNFNGACISITDRVKCATICDPDVGIERKQPLICSSACDEWFKACEDEFWAPPSSNLPLLPCHDQALVCSKLKDSYKNGIEFCKAMGVRVADVEGCITTRADPTRRGIPISTLKKSTQQSSNIVINDLFSSFETLLPWFLRPTVLDEMNKWMFSKITTITSGQQQQQQYPVVVLLSSIIGMMIVLFIIIIMTRNNKQQRSTHSNRQYQQHQRQLDSVTTTTATTKPDSNDENNDDDFAQ